MTISFLDAEKNTAKIGGEKMLIGYTVYAMVHCRAFPCEPKRYHKVMMILNKHGQVLTVRVWDYLARHYTWCHLLREWHKRRIGTWWRNNPHLLTFAR